MQFQQHQSELNAVCQAKYRMKNIIIIFIVVGGLDWTECVCVCMCELAFDFDSSPSHLLYEGAIYLCIFAHFASSSSSS